MRESELDKAGIMSNWLSASEFGSVPESAPELASYFSQGNDMRRLRLELAESGVTIQSRCSSPSRLGVMAEPLGDTPWSWTLANHLVPFRARKKVVTEVMRGETNEHERVRGQHSGAAELIYFSANLIDSRDLPG